MGRSAYCSQLRVHAGLPQCAPRNEGYHPRRQVQAARDNRGVGIPCGEVDDGVVGKIPLGSLVEVAGGNGDSPGHNPVADDPIMGCQRHRDQRQQEEQNGRHQRKSQDLCVLDHVGCTAGEVRRNR